MKKFLGVIFCIGLFSSSMVMVYGWGVWGHEHINRACVFALPEKGGLRQFFYNHIDFMTQASIEPDQRKYGIRDKEEGPRHYINLEWYQKNMKTIPTDYKDIFGKYDNDTLARYGTLPWMIEAVTDSLTNAFRYKKTSYILFYSAVLGHYVGDAHMPLHTSIYHDGKTQKQHGIHSLWESLLPEVYGDKYNMYVSPAVYMADISVNTWSIINHSYNLAEIVLHKEDSIHADFDKKNDPAKFPVYIMDEKGKPKLNGFGSKYYSNIFTDAFNESLHGMVEKQLQASISDLSGYIYTAWMNAGSPDLSGLDAPEITRLNQSKYKAEFEEWQKNGKLFLKNESEFQK